MTLEELSAMVRVQGKSPVLIHNTGKGVTHAPTEDDLIRIKMAVAGRTMPDKFVAEVDGVLFEFRVFDEWRNRHVLQGSKALLLGKYFGKHQTAKTELTNHAVLLWDDYGATPWG